MSEHNAIFYPDLKGKNHKQLHEIAFEQIAETASFVQNDKEIFLKLLWEEWEKPLDIKIFLKKLNDSLEEFEWQWFNDWNDFFCIKKQYPYLWKKYMRPNNSKKEIKIALFYHSIYSRFAELRRYEQHYHSVLECAWAKTKYNIRIMTLDDDLLEKEIVENMNIIQDNCILALPPYIPAGRCSLIYARVRD